MRTILTSLFALAACTTTAATDDTGASTTADTTSTATADGEPTTGADTSGGFETDDTPGDPTILVGSFQVQLVAPKEASAGKTSVLGKIYDGPTPAALVWETTGSVGDCTLMTPRVPFCATPCGGSAVCVEDDTCQAYPTAHSAGTVTAKGIALSTGETEFAMDPIANNYQPTGGVQLAYPAFAEGDTITLAASGEFFPAFELAAEGVAPLVLSEDPLELSADAAMHVKWTAGSVDAATIHVKLDISHHGGTRGMISCDTADSGALELPADMIADLLELGVAGYPTIIVTREVVGATTLPQGRVELVVSSSIERAVTIPGLTSCSADSDCPDGQTCQPDLSCQ